MSEILDTVFSTVKELIADAIAALPGLIAGIIIIVLTAYGANVSAKLAAKLGQRTLNSTSLQLLLEKTAYVLTWMAGILLACVVAFPGLRLGDIIAALGLGSVAVGFAFQDIFKNFLAGILLLLQEPFRIGDQIIIADYEGTVERIEIRTTQIRTYQGERIVLPNSTVFTSAIQVRTAFESRRTDLVVGVDYTTPLSSARNLLFNLINSVDGVLAQPVPEIDLVEFNNSSIDFVVRYWTSPEQREVRRVQTLAILAIKKAFDEADITIPYPIRTVYFYNQTQFDEYLPLEEENLASSPTSTTAKIEPEATD